MNAQPDFPEMKELNALARAASDLGYEIVDIAGFLDLVEAQAREQRVALSGVEDGSRDIEAASTAVQGATRDLSASVERTAQDVDTSATLVRALGEESNKIATWVQCVSTRNTEISDTLKAVKSNNAQIASISMQVNTLAINAKIEAARAGDAGRGFAVVADAINELSKKTKDAARQISSNIETLTGWIATLGTEADDVAQTATSLMEQSAKTDDALSRMEQSVGDTKLQAERINSNGVKVRTAIEAFTPSMHGMGQSIATTTDGIEKAHKRIGCLIDTSETIVGTSAALGGMTEDAPFIDYTRARAAAISQAFEQAVSDGQISMPDLFDRNYVPIPGTAPQQLRTAYTDLLDRILPAIQEPALALNDRVVFCAAVDVNGYLPTHNKNFSHAQSADEVWNTANCRNRRIFDDRVGLKAGRSAAPFLLQVYRRDMGGGEFKMMKDLSAPIMVKGRHWGGLRLAFSF
ncbi:MAG: methyl-accepting chemotaxis protein [Tateyamaria sp.]|uniref:methyl-accepting chemotaxis protein n=1 Tax=Tateyamaria sp. TaxID=1929288 RepID=UPI00329E4F31